MKYNVIHFHAESWDGRMLGSLGHPALRNATPHVDRLAREGAMFEQAYCSHPICCPSRANMWSGRYTQHCESWNNFKGLEDGMESLLDRLPETHTLKTLGKLDYRSGGHTVMNRVADWLAGSGVERPVFDQDPSQCFTVADDQSPRFHHGDWEKADQAIAFLEEQAAAGAGRDGKPFFLTLSTHLTHAAFQTNRYWLDKIPEAAVDLPPVDATDHPCIRYQRMAKGWRFGFEDVTVRQVRRIYFAMCAEADAVMGSIYDAMRKFGLADRTYFVFTSDHGELAMEHQDWYKMSFYEGSVRVPMVMTGPGIASGRRIRNLVSLVDLFPTFLDMAGLPPRTVFDGESLLPLATGATDKSRNTAYACYMGLTLNTTGYMLRKGPWKWVVYVGYPSRLFHLDEDPGELRDLAAARPDIARDLDAELRAVVDVEETHRRVMEYNRSAFRSWRRQARLGLYADTTYGLRGRRESDYRALMNNTFTGYDETDEAQVEAWLNAE
ncbi:MAG: sulfatase-like hydrolase/transferase [Kiritimatiellia bacterium]|nr:sulfatase-like hydrolase/transferase [Kiritimatiellia bacterium]